MYTDNKKYKNNNFDYKIIILLIIIALIVAYFLILKDLFKDRHIKMEESLIQEAKEYVLTNNISTSKEIYFDNGKLNVKLDDDCSFTSGVIFDGSNYKPYLVCNDYKSIITESNQDIKEYITLNGEEVMLLAKGIPFYDPGYISNDLVDVAGTVGTEEGVYNVYYKPKNSNSFAIRKVIIIDNIELRNMFPNISLNGDEVIYIVAGNPYNELGITGSDSVDGDISSKVIINKDINTSVPGEYTITYILTNSRGYSNLITRKVNVINKDSDLVVDYSLTPNNDTNGDVTIKLSISSNYHKIIYPDGKEGMKLTYTVTENGKYKFSIYDTYDRILEKEIEVSNIDKTIPEGTCTATMRYNKTEIKVNTTSKREISSYEYIIDGTSSNSTQTNNFVSNKIKPTVVKVIIKDNINNKNEITCTRVDKTTREIVTNEKGKNCLEGLTCYIQFDYGDNGKYPYCSKSNMPTSCGGIGRNGCSITSVSNAIAFFGLKSKTGVLHTPYTVWDELYPVNKKTGQCNGGCSGWTRMRDAIINSGLSAPKKPTNFSKNEINTMLEHLRKGYPIIIRAEGKPFSSGAAHYLTLLGVRDDNYVFLSDSANRNGTKKNYTNGKQYYVDTWISTDDLVTGHVAEYLMVGPAGMFEG